MSLDARKVRILQAIIDDYILTAVPVGSRTLSVKHGMGLSSATIRNEMSDLEDLGLLDQPHTSAGRIPSWKAYRLYVDQLMRVASLPPQESAYLQSLFTDRMTQMEQVVEATARILSDMTQYPSLVLAPQAAQPTFRRVQFVRVSDERALLVAVFEGGVTRETLVAIPRDWPDDHLYMLSQLLSKALEGRKPDELMQIEHALRQELTGQDAVFASIVTALRGQVERVGPDVALGGPSKLLNYPEYADVDKARGVLGALETRESFARLLTDRASLEFSIAIGPEMQIEGMEGCSLVTVSYSLGQGLDGAMGVIGPTRMHYARVVSVLDAMRLTLQNMFHEEG